MYPGNEFGYSLSTPAAALALALALAHTRRRTCTTRGFSLVARSFTASTNNRRSLASVQPGGMLRTDRRVRLMTKLGDLSLMFFSSAARLRLALRAA